MSKSFKARFYEAVFHSDMSAPAKCIALYVCWHGGCNGDPSKLTAEALMEVASITSEITLRRAKKEVVDAGFVIPGPDYKGGRGNGRLYHPAIDFQTETPSKIDPLSPQRVSENDPLYSERATDFDPLWDGTGSEINGVYAQTPSEIDPVKPESSKRGSKNTPLFSDGGVYIDSDSTTTSSTKNKKYTHPVSSMEVLGAFERYNALALKAGLAQAKALSPSRAKSIQARLKEHGVEGWDLALANIEKSAFLRGQSDRGWRADLDFLIQAKKFTKVMEGGYGNGAAHVPTPDEKRAQEEAMIRMFSEYGDELDAKERAKWQT